MQKHIAELETENKILKKLLPIPKKMINELAYIYRKIQAKIYRQTYLQSFKVSFSTKGNPYDNTCIESFHSVLKKEEVNHRKYYAFNAARKAIFEYIESWYNRKRIHGSIDYMT